MHSYRVTGRRLVDMREVRGYRRSDSDTIEPVHEDEECLAFCSTLASAAVLAALRNGVVEVLHWN
jgi:hypothetical protein